MHQAEISGLASGPEVLIDEAGRQRTRHDLTSPMIVLWVLLFILVAQVFWLKTSSKIADYIDLILFTIAGLLGVLFSILWGWSEHISLHFNFNILWANPLLLILLWTIPAKKTSFNKVFFLSYALLLFFFLISFNRLPQKIPIEAMPVLSILVLKAVNRVFQFREMESKIE
jgi:cation transport ATPase